MIQKISADLFWQITSFTTNDIDVFILPFSQNEGKKQWLIRKVLNETTNSKTRVPHLLVAQYLVAFIEKRLKLPKLIYYQLRSYQCWVPTLIKCWAPILIRYWVSTLIAYWVPILITCWVPTVITHYVPALAICAVPTLIMCFVLTLITFWFSTPITCWGSPPLSHVGSPLSSMLGPHSCHMCWVPTLITC